MKTHAYLGVVRLTVCFLALLAAPPLAVADTTAPALGTLSLSNYVWTLDGTTTYEITVTASDTGSGLQDVRALINLHGSNSANRSGYVSWRDASVGYLWTDDRVACTGGGYASKNPNTIQGPAAIRLLACRSTGTASQRTVTFVVRPTPHFRLWGPINDVSARAWDFQGNVSTWKAYDTNFSVESRPLVSANPHKKMGPPATTPLPGVAEILCTSANAYHLNNLDDYTGKVETYPSYDKPKIISTDAGLVNAATVESLLQRICITGDHFEHWDGHHREFVYNDPVGEEFDAGSTFDEVSADVLDAIHLKGCATAQLTANGRLLRDGEDFYWLTPDNTLDNSGEPITLHGFSWMGALAGSHFDYVAYFDELAMHGVNLTRIWLVEQWTGLRVGSSAAPRPAPDYGTDLIPFAGGVAQGSVVLDQFDPTYFARLRDLVDYAASKGIVVQISLFDRAGLQNRNAGNTLDWGHWLGSPYNPANVLNGDSPFIAGTPAPGDTAGVSPNFLDLCAPTQTAFPPKTLPCEVQWIHHNLINKVRQELADKGNVIFEILNEPNTETWTAAKIETFHRWTAEVAIRDAFDNRSYGCQLDWNQLP